MRAVTWCKTREGKKKTEGIKDETHGFVKDSFVGLSGHGHTRVCGAPPYLLSHNCPGALPPGTLRLLCDGDDDRQPYDMEPSVKLSVHGVLIPYSR